MRWTEAGSGGPTVVLEAASGTPGLTWTPVLSTIAEHTRVIAYDRAGLVLADPAHEDFQPWIIRVAESALTWPSTLRRATGSAERSLREQAVREAGGKSDDPRVQNLLVEAELACNAHDCQRHTSAAESRLLRTHAPAVRQLRARSELPDVPVVVQSASRGLPKGMRTRGTSLQARIAATAVNGEHIVVPDAAHYIHESRPEAVTTAVLSVVDLVRGGRTPH
ncbi:hypothetical protein [Streptomyces sp. SID1034]|uniref:alpha/beta fold hydrolase n=1 Tax=Streptomyces sp. SID1034 TaxID=2690248 RepID=UPI00136BB60C|nr:hypothetical protein [Streptomyces sp. SID1034]MYV93202.1 hypothetical protein [Streptomyces sp. SID1034]